MSDVKIAPCPYCGSKSTQVLRQGHMRGEPFAVMCCQMDTEDTDNIGAECGAQGPYSGSDTGAVARWNAVAGRATDEYGWLIEDTSPSGPAWWRVVDGAPGGWTRDASEALRFARQCDATAMMRYAGLSSTPWIHATEHGFISPATKLKTTDTK